MSPEIVSEHIIYGCPQDTIEQVIACWDRRKLGDTRPSFKQVPSDAKLIGEIGVHKGWNARAMMEVLPEAKFFLIDDYNPEYPTLKVFGRPFTRREMNEFIFRLGVELAPYYNRFKLIFESSLEAVDKFFDDIFDYVYIDNDRDTEQLIKQITLWLPKVKKGGILSGSGQKHATVRAAVEHFFKEPNYSEPDWWVIK